MKDRYEYHARFTKMEGISVDCREQGFRKRTSPAPDSIREDICGRSGGHERGLIEGWT